MLIKTGLKLTCPDRQDKTSLCGFALTCSHKTPKIWERNRCRSWAEPQPAARNTETVDKESDPCL